MQNIKVKQFTGITIEDKLNEWLVNNPTIDVVDIKHTSSDNCSDTLVIYKETTPKERTCFNCVHSDVREYNFPCSACFGSSHWKLQGVDQ